MLFGSKDPKYGKYENLDIIHRNSDINISNTRLTYNL